MASYEEYGKVDVEQALKVMFIQIPYFDFYPKISTKYKEFEFSDKLTDTEKLEEFASVYQQLRKFVGSKMSVVMGMQKQLHTLLSWVDDQLDKSDVYPKTRVDMVYNSLKVDWLRQVRNQVYALIEQREEY